MEKHEVDDNKEALQHRKKMVRGYLADLSYFYDLPRWANEILFELLERMDAKGEIIITMGVKKRIAAALNISVASIKNAICIYHKKQILMREAEGVYVAHPILFEKGQWKQTQDLRVEVSYNEEGVRQVQVRRG